MIPCEVCKILKNTTATGRLLSDNCFWAYQNINCHKVSVSDSIISKSCAEIGRGRRSKFMLPKHIHYQRCTLVKELFQPFYKEFYTVTWCCKEYPHLHSPKCSVRHIKMITWFLFPKILTQGKFFVLFRRSCPWKINIFCYFGKEFLRERVLAKNCDDLWGFFFASLV